MPRPARLRDRNPKRLTISQMIANERVRKAERIDARRKRAAAKRRGAPDRARGG